MTHTVADAEAAIARHPTDLTQLSMAADLLIEAGDPRGEDFAACLAGDLTGEELMRKYPADVSAMYVAAWAMVRFLNGRLRAYCETCGGSGRVEVNAGHWGMENGPCHDCPGEQKDHARAEALRLLAECGKVGVAREHDWIADIGGYFSSTLDFPSTLDSHAAGGVATGWYERMREMVGRNYETVNERLALLAAYAAADTGTRRRWAEETRALSLQPVEVSQ